MLEQEWKKYLALVGLNEANMPADQIRETKRAFMAGCGMMFVLINDGANQEDEKEAVEILETVKKEVSDFWQNETLMN